MIRFISTKYLPYLILVLIIISHLFLLSQMIFFPYPELFIYPYLTNQGLLPYKHIFDQHFPGLMFFPINLDNLGMNTPADARYWQYGTISITHMLFFIVAKRIFKKNRWALLSNLLYLIWQPYFEGYVLWIDLFIVPVLLVAFYFLMDNKNLIFSGLFMGISLLFKQVTLPLTALIIAYLFFKDKIIKNAVYFLIGFLIPLLLLIVWVWRLEIWSEFYYWTITFNITTFAEMGRKYPEISELVKIFPVFGVVSLAILYMLYKKDRNMNMILLTVFFVGSLAFSYARFDLVHLQPSLIFALLLIMYLLNKYLSGKNIVLVTVFILLSIIIAISYYKNILRGDVLFFGKTESDISLRVSRLTKPGDTIFALGTFPHIYQQTDTLPPGKIFVFQFPWFIKEAGDRMLAGIKDEQPKVVVRDKNSTISGILTASFMPEINNYVDENYIVLEEIDSIEILTEK